MALPTTGPITAAMINAELGRPAGTPLSFYDPEVRDLADKPTGPISFSDFRGKSAQIIPGTLVAGYVKYSDFASFTGFNAGETGSLTDLPGAGGTCTTLGNHVGPTFTVTISGNRVAALTGKSVYVNGVAYPLANLAYDSGSNTTGSYLNGAPTPNLVNGQSYQVYIA